MNSTTYTPATYFLETFFNPALAGAKPVRKEQPIAAPLLSSEQFHTVVEEVATRVTLKEWQVDLETAD